MRTFIKYLISIIIIQIIVIFGDGILNLIECHPHI